MTAPEPAPARPEVDGLSDALDEHRRGFRERIRPAFYCTGCDWTAVVVADGRDGDGVTIEDQHLAHLADVLERIVAARVKRLEGELSSTRDALAFSNESVEKMRTYMSDKVGICWNSTCRQPAVALVNGWPLCSEHGEESAEKWVAARVEAALAPIEALATEAIAAIGAGGHSHWRKGGIGGVCDACAAIDAEHRRLSKLLAALRADHAPTPDTTDGGA